MQATPAPIKPATPTPIEQTADSATAKQAVLTPVKQAEICSIVALGGSRKLAARYVNCDPKTIHNTALRDPDFAEKLRKAEVSTEYDLLNVIRDAANTGAKYWQAARWVLQHVYPERYNRRARTISLDDFKDILSQLAAAVLKEIPDPSIRAAVRLQFRTVGIAAIRKAKEFPRTRGLSQNGRGLSQFSEAAAANGTFSVAAAAKEKENPLPPSQP